jgi:hypothetical protein
MMPAGQLRQQHRVAARVPQMRQHRLKPAMPGLVMPDPLTATRRIARQASIRVAGLELRGDLPDVMQPGPQSGKRSGMLLTDSQPLADDLPHARRNIALPQQARRGGGVQQVTGNRVTVPAQPLRFPPDPQVKLTAAHRG